MHPAPSLSAPTVRALLCLLLPLALSAQQPRGSERRDAIRVERTGSKYATASEAKPGAFVTGQDADLVLGAKGFNNSGGPLLLNHPSGLATDGKALLVADRWNNRVLLWKSAPVGNTPPDLVLGQPDFEQNNSGAGRHQLNWPGNVAITPDGRRIAVADTENDRVLIWNSFPTKSGQAADMVIELSALSDGGGANRPGSSRREEAPFNAERGRQNAESNQSLLTSAATRRFGGTRLGWPWGVWTDGTKLAVVATRGAAVLVWNAFPMRDQQPPDFILRPDGAGTPRNVTSDGKSFFAVSDHNFGERSRPATMVWNSFPTSAAQQPDWRWGEWLKGSFTADGQFVAGGIQSVYLWNKPPRDAQTDADVVLRPATYRNGDGPDAVVANGRLYVCTYNGNHILGWNALPTRDNQPADFAVGSDRTDQDTWAENHFIQNPAVATDGKSLFVSSDFDRKLFVWRTLPDTSAARPDLVYNLPDGAWDNAASSTTLALAGRSTVFIWRKLPLDGELPDVTLRGRIGGVELRELTGVAVDARHFYLADRQANRIYVWDGIPNADSEPKLVLDVPNPGRLNSDGNYLCAAPFEGQEIRVWPVAELGTDNRAYRIGGAGVFNLPGDALAADGKFFVADRSNHRVQVWDRVEDALAGRSADAFLGATDEQDRRAGLGRNKLFMPGSVAWGGGYLWTGEFKFSTRILRFSPQANAAAQRTTRLRSEPQFNPNPAPQAGPGSASPRNNQPGPWDNDVLVHRLGPGQPQPLATFPRAGVPTLARMQDGRLIAAFQHFPADDDRNFDRVAVSFSNDEGRTWTKPEPIAVAGMEPGLARPFDPTLVPLPDGRVRLYFTSNRSPDFRRSVPAIYSAISKDGVRYEFEPGVRFAVEGRVVIDCAVALHDGVFHLIVPDNGTPEEMRANQQRREPPRGGTGYHAVSKDGLNFERVADVSLPGGNRWLGNMQSDGGRLAFFGTGPGPWPVTSVDGLKWEAGASSNRVPGADPGAVKLKAGAWLIAVTGPPRAGTATARQRAQPPQGQPGPRGPQSFNAPTRPDGMTDWGAMWSRGQAVGKGPVRFTHAPMRLADIERIVPYGLMVGGHVCPIDHGYFYPKPLRAGESHFDVLAPADGFIVVIGHRTQMAGSTERARDYDDYALTIEHSGTFYTQYDLLTQLDRSVLDQLDAGVRERFTRKQMGPPVPTRIAVKGGQVIGKVGGRSLDFGVVNTEVKLAGFLTPKLYGHYAWRVHVVDPFDFFDEPLRSQLLALNVRKVKPFFGRIDYDVDGRLIGNWFRAGTGGYAGDRSDPRGYWMGHLAFAPHHVDPAKIVVSIGDFDGKPAQFWVKGNAPDPAKITVADGLVKYELIYGQLGSSGQRTVRHDADAVQGVVLAQLQADGRLKLEIFPGRTGAEANGFSAAARTYER
jgi:hypothetical protein